MITEEEKRDIINKAVEEALLALPKVIGNLMQETAHFAKMTSSFYKDHTEFRDHKDVVVSVLEKIDGDNPIMSYEEKLKIAVPEIKRRLDTLGKLDMKTAKGKFDLKQKVDSHGDL